MPAKTTRTPSRRLLILLEILAILIALGAFIAIAGPTRTITCTRTSEGTVDCTIRTALFNLIPLDEFSIPGVMAAVVDQNCVNDDCAYAMQMWGTSGLVPVDKDYVRDLTLRQKVADTINEFLQNKESPSIELRDQVRSVVYWGAGLVFISLFGLLGYTLWLGRKTG